MASGYLWFKALHVAFMVTWFAGLTYLPRLLLAHAETDDAPGRERFQAMEMRLFVLMTVGAAVTVVLGYLLIVSSLPQVSTTEAGLALLLQPTLSFVWDVLFFARPMTPMELVGAAIAIGAIYLGSRKSSKQVQGSRE